MLDTDTKRRIDTCRDILVGKVPDPKSQVEQITVALIYKFMDDMDLESEELGGERKFFTKDYERYRWARLVAPGVSGQEMLNSYSEALTKMVENDQLPELFRSIFRNAYLPYRDPETLRSFLREINHFTYDHSEKLGDAFEYLLSVLGSQGDAGQFRTPRHIIDFMVEIIDPKKSEIIMDPACGTAGFLISAYKHILKANSSHVANGNGKGQETDAAEQALESPLRYPGDLLTPEERKQLARNIKGYDISPDMVRLSLVNLYLHGFADPKVEEYDTLTSEEKWTEMADVILANPPFMSPKGGIKPHTRFQVQSKRSEVLFVDYMAEHLTPQGRAAIIVPEGIIFQSQSAYVALRKMLVDGYLAAVISLPAGVFNPYSGVKTSILILDRAVAKASQHVAFFKIENDGFALGAQRKAVKGSQLAQVKAALGAWLLAARAGVGEELESELGFAVSREELAEGGDYNLSGERYKLATAEEHEIPRVRIAEVCTLNPPKKELSDLLPETEVSFVPMADLNEWRIGFEAKEVKTLAEVGASYTYFANGDVLLAKVTPCFENGKAGIARNLRNGVGFGSSEFYVLRPCENVLAEWVYRCVTHEVFRAKAIPQMTGTGGLQRVPRSFVEGFEIPLPPIEVQREIVAEIEGYQRVIDGARAVIDNYRPHIPVDPDWPVAAMGDICTSITDGDHQPPPKADEGIPFVTISNLHETDGVKFEKTFFVPREYFNALKETRRPIAGDLLYSVTGSYGVVVPVIGSREFCFQRHIALLRPSNQVMSGYLLHYLRSPAGKKQGDEAATGVAQKTVSLKALREFRVPLPSIDMQSAIVAEIEAEQALVNGNRDLIARFEKKIDAAIARVWGVAKGERAT
ncbi:N-6 DNA methylase [Hoeflea alexandrii]|uniref:site-specific DNA-methyltransferase (adenine-specific) n=1 Tax=Hoeflea alexandrii TaxID=288436 RepID=A0ABT1CTJ3_9HYPH|nr:N-6 DNA methylase [Hoeflea alexandrii]MCO6409483.1 N-6 DNA methylase [Hoeflea alexandrii]MCY0152514.1 N-6 DNA methylase [Hoeflea alexandrii]